MLRTFNARRFPLDVLIEAKGNTPTTISVCIPARDEAATVGAIVEAIRHDLAGLVDEVIVVDDHSLDRTAEVAAAAGASVVRAIEGPGKGQALWQATAAAIGDLVVFCDADLRDFDTTFVTGLVGPLLTEPDVAFVKAFYERPLDGQPRGGGRVTELVARPVLSLLFPELAGVVQPLAGEYAARRAVLEQLPFVEGYGVDIGLLIDVAARFGAAAIAQVDLGVRVHRNRPLEQLRPMAAVVLATALWRAGVAVSEHPVLHVPGVEQVEVSLGELPPLAQRRPDR